MEYFTWGQFQVLSQVSYWSPQQPSEVGDVIVSNVQMAKLSHRGVGKRWGQSRYVLSASPACRLCSATFHWGLCSEATSKKSSL